LKNKRLIVFAYDFPPSSGGIARLCYEIALGQNKNFEEIIVLTRNKTGQQKPIKNPNFNIIYLPERRLECELKALKTLRIFNKKNTTIITSLWYPEAFLALLSGHKNIYSLAHGAELLPGNSSFRKTFWIPVFARLILKKIKGVIANSNYTSKLVNNVSPKAKSIALPLGVDTNQFQPLKSKVNDGLLHISTLSRIHQFKGYDQVFDAICSLDKDLQEKVIWHIGGTGPYLEKLNEKVLVNKNYFKIFFHGFIPDEE
jgi:phosphatidylinositol alpha-1,6-mannosyltransferase